MREIVFDSLPDEAKQVIADRLAKDPHWQPMFSVCVMREGARVAGGIADRASMLLFASGNSDLIWCEGTDGTVELWCDLRVVLPRPFPFDRYLGGPRVGFSVGLATKSPESPGGDS